MHLVEVRLNSFLYHFRRLPWAEEARVQVPAGEDARDVLLAHALHDVSGLKINTPEDGRLVIRKIPPTLRRRIWVVYRGNQPDDRYFSTRGLYDAPDHQTYNKTLIEEGDADVDPGEAELVRRFGAAEAHEARQVEQALVQQARKNHKGSE